MQVSARAMGEKQRSVPRAVISVMAMAFALGAGCDDDSEDGIAVDRPDGAIAGAGGTGGTGGAAGADAGVGGSPGADMAPPDTVASASDAQILGVLMEVNSGQIATGALAQSRALNPEVLTFSQMLITDHMAANTRADALATSLGVAPADSDKRAEVRSESLELMADLMAITDVREFEEAYAESQEDVHASIIELIDDDLLPAAQSPELRTELMAFREAVSMNALQADVLEDKLDEN